MDQNNQHETRLHEAWQRLELVCRRLWDSDSPAAVDLQAIIEEFKGEVHRVEQMVSTLRKLHQELRDTVSKEMESNYSEEIRALQLQVKNANERILGLEESLAKKEEHTQQLLKELAAKEALNLEFHDKYLKASTEQDEARAKKMESFYQELMKKETDLEAGWVTRHAALEAEHKQRTDMLKKKHDELLEDIKARATALEEHYAKREVELDLAHEHYRTDKESWDAVRLSEQQSLSKRKEELALQAENLAVEYKKKLGDLQRIKESMQQELGEVVRQYQAKMRNASA
ncbi:MAG TPA: hypothetical protein DEB40_13760 [Elusimicrobia bacterium]|nr:hypothetical protein [Elusimicrobiota bacterium]HBT62800.1 hypothetical protein [Elusimicrobiota bacterium]